MATNDVVMGEKDLNFSEAICSICDNGGDLICCEGRCLRSFHANVELGTDSTCVSLGLSPKIVKEGIFTCENCQHNQHQCHVCGKLGSSDRSTGAEVFQCGDCTCGYFYHPSCVANALRFKFGDVAKDIETEIATGKQFTCPLHYCHACKQKEQEDEASVVMQFAVCRRCPVAYHRKCLPGNIAFEDDVEGGIVTRAWDDLIPNKILIYCMDHVIHEDLQTPPRDHLKFPFTNLDKESENLLEKRQVEKSTPRRKRFSGLYSLREPKKRLTSKSILQKSSSISYMNNSGIYSFRDRTMVTKYSMVPLLSGLKKKICKDENDYSSKTNMDASLSTTDSSNDLEKQRKSSTEVEEHSDMTGVEEQKECAEKEVTACGNDSIVSSKLKNQQSSSSEKKTKSENEKKRKSSENGHSFGSSTKRSKITEQASPAPIVFGLCAQGSEISEKLRDSGSEKARKSSENRTSIGSSEKQCKIIKEVAPVSGASKMQIPKVCGSEKRSESAVEVTGSKDSVPKKLEISKDCSSGKQSEAVEIPADSIDRKLDNPSARGSVKRIESAEKLAVGTVYVSRNLDNLSATGLEKQVESSEKLAGSTKSMARELDNPSTRGSEKRIESAEKLTGSKDFVGTKLENPIARGSEKMVERAEELADRIKDSVSKKLENSKVCSSGKQSEAVGIPADSIDRKLDNPSARGSVKRIESAEKLAVDKVSRKLDNLSARGLEKRVESSEKLAGSTESVASKLDNLNARGSEKQIESAEKLTGSKDSVGTKLENPKARDSEKMVERAEELADRIKDSLCTKLENPKASDLEKRRRSVVNVTCSKDSGAKKIGNNVNTPGSEKTGKTSKTVEASGIPGSEKQRESPKEAKPCHNDAVASTLENKKPKGSGAEKRKSSKKKTKLIKQAAVAVCGANKLVKPTSESVEKVASISKEAEAEAAPAAAVVKKQVVDEVEHSSKKDGEEEENSSRTTATNTGDGKQSCSRRINGTGNGSRRASYKSLDFYKGPYSPPTENNSFGWLIE